MKKIAALVTTLAAVTCGSAFGADLRMPVKAPSVVVSEAFNWSGFYVGGHIGYSRFDSGFAESIAGGGQVGYNIQVSPGFVIGFETDITAMDLAGLKMMGTARARGGFAVQNFLFYGTGGLAWADTASGSLGYAVGGGVEYAFAPNWSTKVEYLYHDHAGAALDTHTITLGLNYRFGWDAPVVARY